MQSFEVKRGHGKTLENNGLKSMMEEEFGKVQVDGNLLTASFKALKNINVEFVSITEIKVETETDLAASPEDSLAAHQAYNRFMESATSFNAKQRIDRAKAKAKKEAKAAAEKEAKAAAEKEAKAPAEEKTENLSDEQQPEGSDEEEQAEENVEKEASEDSES